MRTTRPPTSSSSSSSSSSSFSSSNSKNKSCRYIMSLACSLMVTRLLRRSSLCRFAALLLAGYTTFLPFQQQRCLAIQQHQHHSFSGSHFPQQHHQFSKSTGTSSAPWLNSGQSRCFNSRTQPTRNALRGGGTIPSTTSTVAAATVLPSEDSSQKDAKSDDAEHNINDDKERWRRRGMTLALASCYFTVMGAKCALPSTLSLLTSPTTGLTFPVLSSSTPQQLMARQFTISTLAIAAGKLLLGPIIDAVGGHTSLQIALCSLTVLLWTMSACQTFAVFGAAWVLVDFIFSSCWAACISAVHESFPERDWPKQIGNLAAAARAGNSVAFILFASILQFFEHTGMRQCWRPVFFVAALIQIIPATLLSIFRKKKSLPNVPLDSKELLPAPNMEAHPSIQTSLATLKREAKTPDFWFHLVSRSALMIFASFLLFIPTLMVQVYKTSASTGAKVGSIYALGCLLSVTTLSKLFAQLKRRAKLWAVTLLLLFGATGSSLAQLAHVMGIIHLSPLASVMLLFLWGFSFAVPFYIPPSLYALARGGKESSATIADVFDIAGFGLLALFNGYVASIPHDRPSAWTTTFVITSMCSLVSFVALTLAVLREKD